MVVVFYGLTSVCRDLLAYRENQFYFTLLMVEIIAFVNIALGCRALGLLRDMCRSSKQKSRSATSFSRIDMGCIVAVGIGTGALMDRVSSGSIYTTVAVVVVLQLPLALSLKLSVDVLRSRGPSAGTMALDEEEYGLGANVVPVAVLAGFPYGRDERLLLIALFVVWNFFALYNVEPIYAQI